MATEKSRDYVAEVAEEVAAYLDTHDSVVSAEAAERLIGKWKGTGLLEGWLLTRAHGILAEYISTVSRTRGAFRSREERLSRFRDFSEDFEEDLAAGNTDKARRRAGEFYLLHEVTEDGLLVRRRLCDLTASQVTQVSKNYQRRADDNAFRAKIMDAVAARVAEAGEGATVGSVYTADQVDAMFERNK